MNTDDPLLAVTERMDAVEHDMHVMRGAQHAGYGVLLSRCEKLELLITGRDGQDKLHPHERKAVDAMRQDDTALATHLVRAMDRLAPPPKQGGL
jgi:hypothetical protein